MVNKLLHQWGLEKFHSEMVKLAAKYQQRARHMEAALQRYMAGKGGHMGVRGSYGGYMEAALQRYMEDLATWNFPSGGMFFWVRIKGVLDTSQLMEEALAEGVAIVAGRLFSPDQAPKPFIRLSFSVAGVEEMDKGIKILAEVVKKIQGKNNQAVVVNFLTKGLEDCSQCCNECSPLNVCTKSTEDLLTSPVSLPDYIGALSRMGRLAEDNSLRQLYSKACSSGKPVIFLANGLPNTDTFPVINAMFTLRKMFYEAKNVHIFHVLLEEGDYLLVENEIYANTIGTSRLYGARTITVPSDEEGMLAQDLEDVLGCWATTHPNTKRPRVLYTITFCNNPKSNTWEQNRLKEIYKVCRKYDVIILEDAAYYFMQFHQRRRGFQSIDVDGRVLRFDTFSKILGAGYRLGWLSGPAMLVQKFVMSMSQSTIHPSLLPQLMVNKLLHQWGLEKFHSEMVKLADTYQQKARHMEAALQRYMADVATWNFPSGGMFFWVRIKGVSDTSQLMEEALAEGVAIVAGRLFSPDQAPKPFIRLSFSVAGVEEMDKINFVLEEQFHIFTSNIYNYINGPNPQSLRDLLNSPVSLPDYASTFSRTGRRIVNNILRRMHTKVNESGKRTVLMSGGLPDANTVPAIQAKFFLRDGNVIELDKNDMADVGNYGQSEGLPELREWLTELHRVEHEPPQLIRTDHPEPFMLTITNGITDGLRGVFHVLLDEEDHVLIEDEVYSNTISALTLFGAKPVTVTSDEGGMLAQDLEDVLSSWATTHPNTKRPRVLYTITACNNPKSYTMEQERLIDIYKVCRKYDVIILEDAAYYFMQFQQRRRGFQSIDVDGRVLRFDTFSKIIGAGYRLGWLSGPETIVRKYVDSMAHNTSHPCILSEILISKILHQWGLETFYSEMRKLAAAYEKKAQNMDRILKKYLSDVATWNFPSGGMFFWVRIKGVSDTSQLMEEALAEGVAIVAGRLFSPDQAPKPFIRLSFSVAGVEEMDMGIKILAEVVKRLK
ncbi:uncharacterized protein LOC131942089 [Physella acuta]|uniref:uncharacterized protein LOC131942089 n=1 Tax=Physella acuta TaxID=109671 RepID=UPI0027DD08D2|nr:uncharacterized protein LOC131942089 [Physella acuta]